MHSLAPRQLHLLSSSVIIISAMTKSDISGNVSRFSYSSSSKRLESAVLSTSSDLIHPIDV